MDRGELVAVIGANGSGKSTLARELNALLPLQMGKLTVLGMDVGNKENHHALRRRCGMLFQNPDNQFVSTVAEEDVAFGLYCYDAPEREIKTSVRLALDKVGLSHCARRNPHTLSGGEKQRLALAGIIALNPQIIIFDEAASMLDPPARAEVLDYLEKLRGDGMTIVMITHVTDEAVRADRILVLSDGKLIENGTPRQILTDIDLLTQARVNRPLLYDFFMT